MLHLSTQSQYGLQHLNLQDVNYLPTASYYAIKDLETNEFVVDYDTTYTQLSSDSEGNYFDVYMNGIRTRKIF